MARRVILDTQYTFNPATQTITIPRIVLRERLLLITNVTRNTVIYNFSDPNLTATRYTLTQPTNVGNAVTTIGLNYNTTNMQSTDQLQITIDEAYEVFQPDEAFTDPVGKLRVSQPQSLIDTDFEYGLQPTKWETVNLINNRPSFYTLPANPISLSAVTATQSSTQIVATTVGAPPAVGTPVYVQDTLFFGANGPFLVEANNTGASTFTYTARYQYLGATGSIYASGLTQSYGGTFYSNSAFNLVTQPTVSGNVISFNTFEPHGLQVGDGIYIVNGTPSSGGTLNTAYQVATVTNNTNFSVVATNQIPPAGTITGASVYMRPDGVATHRAFDGGVQFTTGNPAHNQQFIRQTRRYFRYQSGKGIQISTGSILQPWVFIDDMSANGTQITVTTKFPHYIQTGVNITVAGANETAYNGTFPVAGVISPVQFVYYANTVPTASPASNVSSVSVNSWYGSANRLGIFDSQNGMFFEYDGQQLYAVRRRSTDQLSGVFTVTNNSANVTSGIINGFINGKLSKQLVPGDFCVIRGMSYRVMEILDDNTMTISPPYRGSTPSGGVVISKTVDIKVPQSQWNIDKMDGTGPSGQVIDLSKMQMFYIDYSWYGAGAIRFGFRDTQGRIQYVHRFVNNNQNIAAYMRSGNLPARYETNTLAKQTTLAASITSSSQTSMTVASTAGFPNTGTLLIADPTVASGFEYVYYSGISGNNFTGLTRGQGTTTVASCTTVANSYNVTTTAGISSIQPGMMVYSSNGLPDGIPTNTYVQALYPGPTNIIQLTQAPTVSGTGKTFNFVAMGTAAAAHTITANTRPIPVYLHAPQFASTISHWGTSVVMDGQFQSDLSLQFVNGETLIQPVYPNQSIALQSVRVSPSVDSGIPGTLGQKEIINRMQLSPVLAEVIVSGAFLITLVLNGQLTANGGNLGTFGRLANGSSSLAQVVDHTGNVAISGGETIYGFYAVNTAGANNYSIVQGDLTKIRDIGNSILGGAIGNSANTNFYPDGPDILTIVATNVGPAVANVQSRFSWTEAQA